MFGSLKVGKNLAQDEMAKEQGTYEELMASKKEEIKARPGFKVQRV